MTEVDETVILPLCPLRKRNTRAGSRVSNAVMALPLCTPALNHPACNYQRGGKVRVFGSKGEKPTDPASPLIHNIETYIRQSPSTLFFLSSLIPFPSSLPLLQCWYIEPTILLHLPLDYNPYQSTTLLTTCSLSSL